MVLVLVVLVPCEEATLKNKKAGGGLGGRAQRLPPRCIAGNDDGGLCLEPEKRWRGGGGPESK